MAPIPLAALLVALGAPARAGVTTAADAAADGLVPTIQLETRLSPNGAPLNGLLRTPPGLNGSLGATMVQLDLSRMPEPLAPSLIAPKALTAGRLAASKPATGPVAKVSPAVSAIVPSALKPVLNAASVEEKDKGDGKAEQAAATMFDGSLAKEEGDFPVLSFAEGQTTVEPGGLRGLFRRLTKSVTGGAPLLRAQFDDNSRKHYYHGVSLGVLEKAIDNDGGKLKAGLTFLSDEAGYPYGYARTSMRRTGTAGTVLQFEPALIESLIKPGHFNPRAPERGEKWEDVPHWFQADQDIPLSAQTAASKKTVLDYLADQRDAHPRDQAWADRVAKFEKAFGMKARDAKVVEADPLALEGLKRKGEKWFVGDKQLARLGSGTVGRVDVHPTRPGLVVKTIDPSVDQFLFAGLDIKTAIAADEKAAQVLAAAGVGPAFFGGKTVDGRRVSVRERVFGQTMGDIIAQKKFGAEEEALVLDMVRRMAEKNVLVSDLKPENIMIGTTERDPVRKAWFIDGGIVEEMPAGLTVEQRMDKILDYPNVIALRQDYNARQVIETIRTLRFYVADGREDSSLSGWRLFLKKFLAALVMGGVSAANK